MEKDRSIENAVAIRVMQLGAVAQGISLGVVLALGVFVATNWLVLKGGEEIGPHLSLLSQYFIGYRVTFLGSLIGATYAFVIGFFFGFTVAKVYNLIASKRG